MKVEVNYEVLVSGAEFAHEAPPSVRLLALVNDLALKVSRQFANIISLVDGDRPERGFVPVLCTHRTFSVVLEQNQGHSFWDNKIKATREATLAVKMRHFVDVEGVEWNDESLSMERFEALALDIVIQLSKQTEGIVSLVDVTTPEFSSVPVICHSGGFSVDVMRPTDATIERPSFGGLSHWDIPEGAKVARYED